MFYVKVIMEPEFPNSSTHNTWSILMADDKDFTSSTDVATAQVNYEAELVMIARLEKVRQGVRMRDFYHKGIDRWVKEREEIEQMTSGKARRIRRMYLSSLVSSADNAERLTITVAEEKMQSVRKWADKDGRSHSDLLYSALIPVFEDLERDHEAYTSS